MVEKFTRGWEKDINIPFFSAGVCLSRYGVTLCIYLTFVISYCEGYDLKCRVLISEYDCQRLIEYADEMKCDERDWKQSDCMDVRLYQQKDAVFSPPLDFSTSNECSEDS